MSKLNEPQSRGIKIPPLSRVILESVAKRFEKVLDTYTGEVVSYTFNAMISALKTSGLDIPSDTNGKPIFSAVADLCRDEFGYVPISYYFRATERITTFQSLFDQEERKIRTFRDYQRTCLRFWRKAFIKHPDHMIHRFSSFSDVGQKIGIKLNTFIKMDRVILATDAATPSLFLDLSGKSRLLPEDIYRGRIYTSALDKYESDELPDRKDILPHLVGIYRSYHCNGNYLSYNESLCLRQKTLSPTDIWSKEAFESLRLMTNEISNTESKIESLVPLEVPLWSPFDEVD